VGSQTGGARRTWLFDVGNVDNLGPIRDTLVHYDEYFSEDPAVSTLAIVMDQVLVQLPETQADCVRLVYLEGHSYRTAGKILGIDHKTVKARADKGVAAMRARLVDSVWIAEMLRGYIPSDEVTTDRTVRGAAVADILSGLKGPAA
jgi:DNA-directed RNA polymerase specialized sigma24 family protein